MQRAPSGVARGRVSPAVANKGLTGRLGEGEKVVEAEALKRWCGPQVVQLERGRRRAVEPVSKMTLLDLHCVRFS